MTERECRRIVNARAEGRCERCSRPMATTVHHRRKRSQGGPWSPSNCVALCGHGTAGCHGWVESNPLAAHSEGLWLRAGEPPEEISLIYRWQRVLLDNTGGIDLLEAAS